jgi:hypothetical protein
MKMKLYQCNAPGCGEYYATTREPFVCPYCDAPGSAKPLKDIDTVSDIEKQRRMKGLR